MKTLDYTYTHFLNLVLILLCVQAASADEPRPFCYPFDVTVSKQQPIVAGEYAIVAQVAKPVANDAEVIIPGVEAEMIMAQIAPCDAKGEPIPGAASKTIYVPNGTKFKLNQTMDKSTLKPGRYLMNVVLRSKGTSRIIFKVK